jgi:hypothetical protein
MKGTRHSEEQIIAILKQGEAWNRLKNKRKLRSRIPLHRQFPGRQSCLILSLGYNTNKILAHDDLHKTWNTPHRLFINMEKGCAHLRGTDDSPVQHPRDSNVVNELEPASHQGGSVE